MIGITQSVAENNWVDETPYEVSSVMVGGTMIQTDVCKKGRENALLKVLLSYLL